MYSPFRYTGFALWKRRPIHLTFFVTRRCNSGCPFCFYLKSASNERDNSSELQIDEIGKISRSMGGLLWLAFSGGEIYLREDLAEIAGIFYRNNRPAIMLFPTNGLLPPVIREKTGHVLEECRKSVIAVKLSIDGIGDAHDTLRNTPGSFDKTMQTYHMLEELLYEYPNFELGVNTVFCSENQDNMDDIIDFVRGLKNIKTHTISLIRGDLSDKSFKEVDYGKYFHAVERLESNLKNGTSSLYRFRGARLKGAQDILQRRLIHRTALEHKRVIPCYAGTLNLVLTEKGDVYPCEILTEKLGNIREHEWDVMKVLQSDRAAKIIDSINANRCYCTHECYFMTNILFNPRLYPSLFREYFKL